MANVPARIAWRGVKISEQLVGELVCVNGRGAPGGGGGDAFAIS